MTEREAFILQFEEQVNAIYRGTSKDFVVLSPFEALTILRFLKEPAEPEPRQWIPMYRGNKVDWVCPKCTKLLFGDNPQPSIETKYCAVCGARINKKVKKNEIN